MRWGLLGASTVTDAVAAPAMRAVGHDLAVVGSRSLSRAQAFAANHGVRRARGSYEEVIEARDVDAVYVALPNDLHEQWAVAALAAGKHVLCERPLATDAASAGRLAAASGSAGRLLMESAPTRYHPRTAALLELVHGGDAGQLRHLSVSVAMPLRQPSSFRAQPEHGGGALLDLGVQGIAACRWLAASEPDEVAVVQRRSPSGVDQTTVALLGWATGPTASVYAAFDAVEHQSLEVVGTEGTLRMAHAFSVADRKEVTIERDGRVVGTWRANPYEVMVQAFADAAGSAGRRGPAPLLSIDDAVSTAAVADRVRAALAGRATATPAAT